MSTAPEAAIGDTSIPCECCLLLLTQLPAPLQLRPQRTVGVTGHPAPTWDSDGVPGFWFLPGPAVATAAIWGEGTGKWEMYPPPHYSIALLLRKSGIILGGKRQVKVYLCFLILRKSIQQIFSFFFFFFQSKCALLVHCLQNKYILTLFERKKSFILKAELLHLVSRGDEERFSSAGSTPQTTLMTRAGQGKRSFF